MRAYVRLPMVRYAFMSAVPWTSQHICARVQSKTELIRRAFLPVSKTLKLDEEEAVAVITSLSNKSFFSFYLETMPHAQSSPLP